MGETINLVENFKVEKVIFNCGEFNELEQELIKVLDKKKISYYSCIEELKIDDNKLYFLNNKDYGNENDNSSVIYTEFKNHKFLFMGDAGVEVEQDLIEKYNLQNIDDNKLYFLNNKNYENENDNSSVIYTELNNHKFLFMGDAGVEVEEDLIEKYSLKDIDVLKVGHHGSKTSSSKSFIDEINPKYSIISVGKNNRYGHPNKEVLENLEKSKIYRTDMQGSIMFKIKNNKLEINTCSP